MRRITLLILILSGFQEIKAVNFEFVSSSNLSLINFLETTVGGPATSVTYKDSILNSKYYATELNQLASDFQKLELAYNYQWQQFPQARHSFRTTEDLIKIAAVETEGLEEFGERIIGMIPEEDRAKLLDILRRSIPYYEKIVNEKNRDKLEKRIGEMGNYIAKIENAFNRLNIFYKSNWPADQTFKICLYPMPGQAGHSTATPHGNILIVGVFTDNKDIENTLSVGVHEMCHILFDSQTAKFQHHLDNWFKRSASPYAALAYSFIDEGLATACGNGWAYKQLKGKVEEGKWYNNEYIDGFGHSLFPLVEKYLDNSKTIDSVFINQAIKLFAERFPNSVYEYGTLLSKITLFTDARNAEERGQIHNHLSKNFAIYGYNSSSPILDEKSKQALNEASGTRLIIIFRNQLENLEYLRSVFPPLSKIKGDSEFIASFIEEEKGPVIIIRIAELNQLPLAMDKMRELQFINKEEPFYYLN